MINRIRVVSTFISIFFILIPSVWAAKSKVEALPPKISAEAVKLKKIESVPGSKASKSDTASYLEGLVGTVDDTDETEPVRIDDQDAKRAESDIPLVLGAQKVAKPSKVGIFQKMVGILGSIVLFALIAFFFIHRSSKRGSLGRPDRNIKILTQKSLGHRRDLIVIKVAGESILLGVTEQNINLIKNLSILDDEMPQFTDETFSQNLNQNLVPQPNVESSVADHEERVDGFAISKLSEVRDVVSQRYSRR